MDDPNETVTLSVAVNLDNVAQALVHTLDSNGLQTFIFQLIALRDDDQLDRELGQELTTPLAPPDVDLPHEVLEAAARQIHTGYDRAAPVERSEAREAARDALLAAAAVFQHPRQGGAPWTS